MDKKILIVSWYGESETGGVEFVTYYLHKIWGAIYDVDIIDFKKIKQNTFFARFLDKHYVLDAIIVSVFCNKYIKEQKKQLGKNNVYVVTQGYNAPFVKADIAFAHGNMRGFELNAFKKTKWDFYERFEKLSFKKARKIIAVGNHVKTEANKYYGTNLNKIEVIENCVDTSLFFPKPKEVHPFYNIIFCGRLTAPKNPQKLLEFAKYIENHKKVKLIIATPSSDNVNLFKGLKNTEIRIGLKKDEMNDFYNCGDVMYFPSLYEGFGLVTCECLAAGVPVFGNMVGAIGDFYNSGRKGIGIISGDNEKDLNELIMLAENFNTMVTREELHNQVVKYNNFDTYRNKLLNAVKDVIMDD